MARIFQDTKQKRKQGKKAPWLVEWRDGEKRYTRKIGNKTAAQEFAHKIEGDLVTGEFQLPVKKSWREFRAEYESICLPNMRSEHSKREAQHALNLFEQLVRPTLVRGINEKMLDEYVARRRVMPGAYGRPVAAATMRKELRGIRAALSHAQRWRYLGRVPRMPRIAGYAADKRFVSEEHFVALIESCPTATEPTIKGSHITADDWWKALLSLLWVAPLRIQSALALEWIDIDLQRGRAVSRAWHNKQKKDQVAFFPASVAAMLRRIRNFEGRVFPWPLGDSALYGQFRRLQKAAGIYLPCSANHEHTNACHYYGFHDFRRSFACYNRGLPATVVQGQMGHSSYQTTLLYDQYGRDHESYADRLHVPGVLRIADE